MMEIRNTEAELQRFRVRAVVMGVVVFLAVFRWQLYSLAFQNRRFSGWQVR